MVIVSAKHQCHPHQCQPVFMVAHSGLCSKWTKKRKYRCTMTLVFRFELEEIINREEIILIQYYPVLTYVIIGHDPIKRRNAMS